MTPVQQGKFCGSCQKQVVDFSDMSDRQVAEFFKKPSTGSVCGRFMADQLDRSIEIPRKRIPWLRYFFQFVIPAFLVSLKASAEKRQGKIKVTAIARDTVAPPVCRPTMGIVARPIEPVEKMGLKGRVVDAVTGKALPGASVTMNSSIGKENIGINEDGSFMLNIYRKITVYNIEVSLPGYITQNIKKNDFNISSHGSLEVKMLQELMIRGEIAVNVCRRASIGDTTAAYIEQPVVNKNGIDGKVVDEKGDPLPGASVIIKGTRNGVSADNNGAFNLPAKKGEVLQIFGVGLETTEYIIGSDSYILISVRRIILGGLSITISPVKKEVKPAPVMAATSNDPAIPVLNVFPNPVEAGTSLNIELKQAEEGYYKVQLLNQSGQSVHQQEIWIDAEARLLNIDIPIVAAGSYFLALTNKKSGKRFTEKIIIQ